MCYHWSQICCDGGFGTYINSHIVHVYWLELLVCIVFDGDKDECLSGILLLVRLFWVILRTHTTNKFFWISDASWDYQSSAPNWLYYHRQKNIVITTNHLVAPPLLKEQNRFWYFVLLSANYWDKIFRRTIPEDGPLSSSSLPPPDLFVSDIQFSMSHDDYILQFEPPSSSSSTKWCFVLLWIGKCFFCCEEEEEEEEWWWSDGCCAVIQPLFDSRKILKYFWYWSSKLNFVYFNCYY